MINFSIFHHNILNITIINKFEKQSKVAACREHWVKNKNKLCKLLRRYSKLFRTIMKKRKRFYTYAVM